MLKHLEATQQLTMDPWTSSTWREALEQIPHPQQGNQGQTQQICTTEDTQRYQS